VRKEEQAMANVDDANPPATAPSEARPSDASPSDASPSEFNRSVIAEFRANGGRVGGGFKDAPLLLLTTTGARSGRSHTAPVVYSNDGERIVVFASKAGAPTNPAWYHNLVANPIVTVEVGMATFHAAAVVAEGEERQRLWDLQVERMPGFGEYQDRTTRQIPVVVLERRP